MSIEIETESERIPHMPADVYEQLAALPEEEVRSAICTNLALGLSILLADNGVKFEDVTARVKTKEKIERKITRRGSAGPVRDIYGVRFITREPDRGRIAKIIQSAFPNTPQKFENGMPSVREYADSETRALIQANFNPHISDRHSALHINIVFLREGTNIYDIAEVQILTPDELKIFYETREEYENGHGSK